MRIKLVNRGKVREIYSYVRDPFESEHLDFECETPNYIVTRGMVLDKRTRAVMGTLFDNNELSKIKELTKQSGRYVDAALSIMFLGYSAPVGRRKR